jgi:hypothetical protein
MVEDKNGDSRNMPEVLKKVISDQFFEKIDYYEGLFDDQVALEVKQPKVPKKSGTTRTDHDYYSHDYFMGGYESPIGTYSDLKKRLDLLKASRAQKANHEQSEAGPTYEGVSNQYAQVFNPGVPQPMSSSKENEDENMEFLDYLEADSDSDDEDEDAEDAEDAEEAADVGGDDEDETKNHEVGHNEIEPSNN